MKQLLDAQIKKAKENPELIVGYAVVVVGTRRSSFVTEECDTSYRESKAAILPRNEAEKLLEEFRSVKPDLAEYTQIIPCLEGVGEYSLPTQGGTMPGGIPYNFEEDKANWKKLCQSIKLEIHRANETVLANLNAIYEPKEWLEWLQKKYRERGFHENYIDSIQPWNIKCTAYDLAFYILRDVSQGYPHFAIAALLTGEVEVDFYRAVAIWANVPDNTQSVR